jgi:hypothetical protein
MRFCCQIIRTDVVPITSLVTISTVGAQFGMCFEVTFNDTFLGVELKFPPGNCGRNLDYRKSRSGCVLICNGLDHFAVAG